jgi:hypothetical protein
MNSNKTVTANFSQIPHFTLRVLKSGEGSVTHDGTSHITFDRWTGDATGSNIPVQIEMTTNKLITAVFGQRPSITGSQPHSMTREQGETVIFSVSAIGSPPLNYQWYFNTNPIPGANATNLTLPNITAAHDGDYSVWVSNAFGSVPSPTATLIVTNTFVGTNRVTVGRAGSALRISFIVAPGMTYELQRSTNLFSWQSLETIGPQATNGPVVRTIPAAQPAEFFRVRNN